MSAIDPRVRSWLLWLAPFVLIGLAIAWEANWGRGLWRAPNAEAPATPQPVQVALLPDYKLEGGVESRRETTERTLFNPTRRPAPAPLAVVNKPTPVGGQFALTGTTMIDDKATAFLREVNGGKSRRVAKGETINGWLVAEVLPDRVKLTQSGVTDEVTMKIATGPKSTIQPAIPVVTPPPAATAAGQPVPGQGDVANVLAERRRAARAAEAAAQQNRAAGAPAMTAVPTASQPAQFGPPPPGSGATTQQADPRWNDTYERMRQKTR
jgi:hypothetical protein